MDLGCLMQIAGVKFSNHTQDTKQTRANKGGMVCIVGESDVVPRGNNERERAMVRIWGRGWSWGRNWGRGTNRFQGH